VAEDVLPAGIFRTAPHFGHFPFLPAAEVGVRTCFWHFGQGNSITAPRLAALSAAWAIAPVVPAPALRFGNGGEDSGICTTVPQLGHFPFLPAAEPGVRTGLPHVGQGNSILSLVFPAASGLSEVTVAEGANRRSDSLADESDALGIRVSSPQCGHRPLLPAAESGVRMRRLQA
jgi:hypothetical protein